MKLKQKQRLDHTLGTPLLILTWLGVRLVSRILSRSHGVKPVRRIIILKFQGMGSLVMAKPALSALREWYPESKIWFWGSQETANFAQLCPEFNRVLILKDRTLLSAAFSALQSLIQILFFRADWAIDLEVYSKLSTVLTSFTLARNRAGFAVDAVSLRRNCHTHLILFNRYRYLGESYARLIGLLEPETGSGGISLLKVGQLQKLADLPRTLLHTDEQNTREINFSRSILFHIHTGVLAPERKWPMEKWVELATLLSHSSDPETKFDSILLTGKGVRELKASEQLIEHCKMAGIKLPIHNFTDELTLAQTITLLRDAAFVISADTSIPHLAALMGTATIGLFGPTRAETYFASYLPWAKTVSKPLFCSPCVHHWPEPPCDGRFECMKLISAKEVFNEIALLLKNLNSDSEPVQSEGHGHIQLRENQYREGMLFTKEKENACSV